MKAISIKQPWAGLIAQGKKRLEIRSWQTHFRGDILICASAKPDLKTGFSINLNQYPFITGNAICIAELYHVEPFLNEHEAAALCNFNYGLFAWHLRNIRQIEPFAVKGKLNFFNVEL